MVEQHCMTGLHPSPAAGCAGTEAAGGRLLGLPDYFQAALETRPDDLIYVAVADALGSMIRDAELPPGERLPSLRSVARRLAVSVTTAVRAYGLLVENGLAEARAQSGYFVAAPRVEGVPVPVGEPDAGVTLSPEEVMRRCDRVARESLLPLPAWLEPGEELRRAVSRGVGTSLVERSAALTPSGDRQLRRALAAWLSVGGVGVAVEDLMIMGGTCGALDLALRCAVPGGGRIVVESPIPAAVLRQIAAHGCSIRELPADPGIGMDSEALGRLLAREEVHAVVVLGGYTNPAAGVLCGERRDRIIACTREYGIPLIEFDAAGDLCHDGSRPAPLAAEGAEHVLTCGALSAVAAPGFMVGWLLAPGYRESCGRQIACSGLGPGVFPQGVLAEYIASGGYGRHLDRARRRVSLNIDCMRASIAGEWPAGLRVTRPAGGVALWVSFPFPVDDFDWRDWGGAGGPLRVVPGRAFTASGYYRECIRVSLNEAWSARCEQAFRVLGARLVAHRDKPPGPSSVVEAEVGNAS